MNDWLNYKGSGSARAYTGDYIGPSIGHKRRTIIDDAREGIDNAVGRVMDKVTNADLRASDARDRQRRADERLKQSQIERKAKEIRDAASKLEKDSRSNLNDFLDYRAKYRNLHGYNSLGYKQLTSKNPRAVEQIDSAIRNMTSDLKRMIEKINRKDASLRTELDRVKGMYNDFVNSNPPSYVKDVPDILKQAEIYLSSVKLTSDDLF